MLDKKEVEHKWSTAEESHIVEEENNSSGKYKRWNAKSRSKHGEEMLAKSALAVEGISLEKEDVFAAMRVGRCETGDEAEGDEKNCRKNR